ncbi:MAG TPA: hypothetical protein VGS04_00100 [Nitrososphaerales archaeon]|nr:hypothetical protein [Nitrososphaerales archaeon]
MSGDSMSSGTQHRHEIVLAGMVNVNRDNYLQGVVDVWTCRGCKKLFCDDKRYGEPLKPSVGFEEVPDDEQWGILTCTDIKGVYMMSLGIKPGKTLKHTCPRNGSQHEFVVKEDWTIAPDDGETVHRLFLVKDHINKVIEAGFYKLRMLK